jgi:hypothetical protein
MISLLSFEAFVHDAVPLAKGISPYALTNFKVILTTVLLGIAIAQAFEQALLYKWIRVRNLNRRLVVRLHRIGGATAVVLILAVVASCWYTWLGLGYPLNTLRVVAHAVLGGLAVVVLLTKVAMANWFRQYLGYTLPIGISAGALLLGVFLLMALPRLLGLV